MTSLPPTSPSPSPPRRLTRFALATLSGVLVFLSFPLTTQADSNLYPLGWFALIPLLFALRDLRPRHAFALGAWMGFVTNFGGFWWVSVVVRDFGHLPPLVYWPVTALNAAYQGLMFALVATFWARSERAHAHATPLWRLAALFTVIEWLFPMIFPWYLANGQYRFLPAIQIAELGGVMSVTFIMVLFQVALYRLLAHRRHRDPLPKRAVALALTATALSLIYGLIRIPQVDAQAAQAAHVTIGLVEADIGIFEKQADHLPLAERRATRHANLLKHQEMSAALAAQGVDLIVWPESSYFPVGDPALKTTDHMAFALTTTGEVLAWDASADPAAGTWSPIHTPTPGTQPPTPGTQPPTPGTQPPTPGTPPPTPGTPPPTPSPLPTALAAADETAWVALTPTRLFGALGPPSTAPLLTAPLPAGATPRALALASSSTAPLPTVWLVGDHGFIASGPLGSPLIPLRPPTDERLTALALLSPHDGLIASESGTLFTLFRDEIRPLAQFPGHAFRALALAPTGQALVVGDAGLLVAGTLPDLKLLPTSAPALRAAAIDRSGTPWVAGVDGYVAILRDGLLAPRPLPIASDVTAFTIDPLDRPLAATADGSIFMWNHPSASWLALPAPPSPLTALVPAGWIQDIALPRDTRWVRQSALPLPPPTAAAADLGTAPAFDRAALQRGFATPLLFGGVTWEPQPDTDRARMFNTAVLLDESGRVAGTYDKVYLLAFGEYLPFGETFPSLYDAFPHTGRFTPGSEVKVFDWRGFRLGVMVCYEDIMANFTGRLARLRPNVLINVTNDAWFGKTSEPWLHLALAVFRAVENRLELIRSTNTGISAFIDPTGRIQAATRIDDAETLVREVPMMPGETPYVRLPNLFVWTLLIALIALPLFRRLRRISSKK